MFLQSFCIFFKCLFKNKNIVKKTTKSIPKTAYELSTRDLKKIIKINNTEK